MSARSVLSVWARVEWLACGLTLIVAAAVAACGQKGVLIAVKPALPPASAATRAPLPPPEPLEPPIPGTAPR